ncbi:MAG: carbohydrate kinase family protein [Chloroflexi bacterium]|nr:carbohydrate kinase family protein [Chloroflexota bacterium]
MAITSFDILVAGEINPDLILSDPDLSPQFGQKETLVDKALLTAGSSSVIFAAGAARLGLRVGFVGVVGDDCFGHFMLDALSARIVDVSNVIVDPSLQTGFGVILNRGTDRAILTYPGAVTALRADMISDDLLAKSRHLHVASYFLQTGLNPGLHALFERAQRFGLSTSLDTNWDPSEEWKGVGELLHCVTMFLPNAVEAISISGEEEVQHAALALASRAKIVAVKLGEAGALVCDAERLLQAPAPTVEVADTVGAGDSFDAGFVFGFLQDWNIEACLDMGIICGSLSTRKSGGVAAQPTLEEALAATKIANTHLKDRGSTNSL